MSNVNAQKKAGIVTIILACILAASDVYFGYSFSKPLAWAGVGNRYTPYLTPACIFLIGICLLLPAGAKRRSKKPHK